MIKSVKKPGRDIILTNANIITFNPLQPIASWLAISGNKIRAIGKPGEPSPYRPSNAEIIECNNRTVLPGFIDSHLHLLSYAANFTTLNLTPAHGVHSINDILERIYALSKKIPRGTWIRAKGYNEYDLREKRHPNRKDLDKISPDHPVKLSHRTGHAHVLNTCALNIVGITSRSPDPPAGIIERELDTGLPSGLIFEMGDFLAEKIPQPGPNEIKTGIKIVNQELVSYGITSIQDASPYNDTVRYNLFRTWKENGQLYPRLIMMAGAEGFEEAIREDSPHYLSNQLQINGVKIILDETTGDLHPSQEKLNDLVLKIHKSNMQACIHAIKENAVQSACSAIEKALEHIPKKNHRHRIEHCSICPPGLAERIKKLGIMVVSQPGFIYYNGDRYLDTVKHEQLKNIYPFGTLLRNNVRIAGSSDTPVAPPDPLTALYSAVSRKSETGRIVNQEENIQITEALRLYTTHGAEAHFAENIKGSIATGKLADLVVLSRDPAKIPPDELKDIKVEMTIIDGKIVWTRA